MGALARGAAGAIGHRDEIGRQRLEPLDRLPQNYLHRLVFRREEFERHIDAAFLAAGKAAGANGTVHHATSRRAGAASSARTSRASHSDTAILPSEPGSGLRLLCIT